MKSAPSCETSIAKCAGAVAGPVDEIAVAVHDGRGLGEGAHRGLDRAFQRGLVGRGERQDRELEILVLVIVIVGMPES